MSPKDWFGVGTRIIGIYCFMEAGFQILKFFDIFLGFAGLRGFFEDRWSSTNAPNNFISALMYSGLTFLFLFCTNFLNDITFTESQKTEKKTGPWKPEEWFGLALRLTGIFSLLQVVNQFIKFLNVRLGFHNLWLDRMGLTEVTSPVGYLLFAFGYVVLAGFFLLGANYLIYLTFKGERTQLPTVTLAPIQAKVPKETPAEETPPNPKDSFDIQIKE